MSDVMKQMSSGDEQPRAPTIKPSELSGEALRIELRNAMARLSDIEDGRAPRYDDVDRTRLSQLAQAAMQQPAQGVGSSLSQLQQMAHGIVNSMAAIDGHKADNPFTGSKLSGTYASAQRWQAHLARQQERPTLQSLLNARAELVSTVDKRALALHQAQREEAAAYHAQASSPQGLDTYRAAYARSKEETERFAQAVVALREFRAAPTDEPQLKRTFQDLEALELVVNKTERSIRDAASAGMIPDELDNRDLRHNQMALKAFLRLHDATIPIHNAATPADRRSDRQDLTATATLRA